MTKKQQRILESFSKKGIMYKDFYVYKISGTYAETLEAFGVANLVNDILKDDGKITIEDNGLYYLVSSNQQIPKEKLYSLSYFQIFKFLIKSSESLVPKGIPRTQCFDYPSQKAAQDQYKEQYQSIEKNKSLSQEQKRQVRKKLNKQKLTEFGSKIDAEYDVYRELTKNPYTSYQSLYNNFYNNKQRFGYMVKEIFDYYAQSPTESRDYELIDEEPTAQQLLNPNQGKGLNKSKANNVSMGNLKSSWITETMKISGALRMMSIQYIKVGTGYDLKIYVPEFKNIQIVAGKKIVTEFKRYLKSASPIKLDILNILDLIINFIELTPDYKGGKVKNTIQGFHSVYQKDLGQNKAVANMSFINTPDFIAYTNAEEGREWKEILAEQRSIISGIQEIGSSIAGLQDYRCFLGSVGSTALNYFSGFSYWYAGYLMQCLDKEKYYVKPFKSETLSKFYKYMDTVELNLSEIIRNEGFQAVTRAIRKSTVSLQYTPKEQRKFEIRYGFAQELQNKSKSKVDLATFIGEFIGTYNAETARAVEKTDGKVQRANIKDEELAKFYEILDKTPSRLVGALLASYGFALNKKEVPQNADPSEEDESPIED